MANNVKFKAPALPIPPAQYNQSLYQRTFSILRLYFNQLDEHLRQDLGDTTINGDLTVTGGVTAGATTINGELAVNANTLKLTSTTPNSTTENPSIELFRDGGTAASGSEIGAVKFFGTNNASEKFEYAGIYAETEYPVDGNEQGCMKFKLGHGGGQEDPAMSLFSYGLVMGYGNPILMSYSNGYMQFYSPNAAQKSFKLNATPNATVANGAYDIYLPDVTSGTLAVTNSAVAFTAGAITGTTLTGTLQTAAQTNITSVGALNGGSITSGFGTINNGSSTITTTGAISGGTLTGTLQTAAQTNITSVGALDGGSITSGFGTINNGGSSIVNTGTFTLGATSPYAPYGIINGGLTLNLGTGKTFDMVSTNTGADDHPVLNSYRDSSSPADADTLGTIRYQGNNDADQKVIYAEVEAQADDVTDGTEDGAYKISRMVAGTSTLGFELNASGVTATGATTVNGSLTVNNDVMEVVSTDAGATAKPVLKLTRNSSSPADNDVLGVVEFHGENSAGTDKVYGSMDCVIVDEGTGVSGNYVKGQIRFNVATGALQNSNELETPAFTIDQTGVYIGNENGTGLSDVNYYNLYRGQGLQSFSISKTYNTKVTFDEPTANRSIKIPDVGGSVVVAGMAGGDINGGGGTGSPKTAWSLAEFKANPNVLYTHYNASNSTDLVVAVPFAGVDIGLEKYGSRYVFTNTSPAGSEIVIDLDGFTYSGTQYYVTIKYDGGTNATITSASSNLVVAAGGTIELIPVTGGIFLVTGIGYS